jgi:hypothetical protein
LAVYSDLTIFSLSDTNAHRVFWLFCVCVKNELKGLWLLVILPRFTIDSTHDLRRNRSAALSLPCAIQDESCLLFCVSYGQ